MVNRRMTKQRLAILEILREKDYHPTADEIYARVRKKVPNVSLGTIYRNLNLLVEEGIITEVSLNSKHACFDGNSTKHYHFKCRQCGGIFDVPGTYRFELDRWVEEVSPFQVDFHSIEFCGLCNICKKQKKGEATSG